MNIKCFSFIALLLFVQSCDLRSKSRLQPDHSKEAKKALLDADRAFSAMSETKGMKNAFIDYIDSNGVLLRPGQLPIIGADAIDFLTLQDDKAYTLTWEPKDGEVAKSGEIGYTYGVFSLRFKDKDSVQRGTYVSIWKLQSDGSWKFTLDSGNDGIDE